MKVVEILLDWGADIEAGFGEVPYRYIYICVCMFIYGHNMEW
jgi:hypothetical protein